jgi:hypothetical protein
MNARERLEEAVSFAEASNLGMTPDGLLDAYRAEVLREAADIVGNDDDCACGGCDTCVPRKLADQLRRMADEATS